MVSNIVPTFPSQVAHRDPFIDSTSRVIWTEGVQDDTGMSVVWDSRMAILGSTRGGVPRAYQSRVSCFSYNLGQYMLIIVYALKIRRRDKHIRYRKCS